MSLRQDYATFFNGRRELRLWTDKKYAVGMHSAQSVSTAPAGQRQNPVPRYPRIYCGVIM